MKKISTVLTLFALMLTLSACGGRDSVADAKGTMFDSINAAATLGEMVDVVICNAQWSSEKVSDNLYNYYPCRKSKTYFSADRERAPQSVRDNPYQNQYLPLLPVFFYREQG